MRHPLGVIGGMLEVVLEVALENLVDLGVLVGQSRRASAELPSTVSHEPAKSGGGQSLSTVALERVVDGRHDVPARIDEGSVEIKHDPPGRLHHLAHRTRSVVQETNRKFLCSLALAGGWRCDGDVFQDLAQPRSRAVQT